MSSKKSMSKSITSNKPDLAALQKAGKALAKLPLELAAEQLQLPVAAEPLASDSVAATLLAEAPAAVASDAPPAAAHSIADPAVAADAAASSATAAAGLSSGWLLGAAAVGLAAAGGGGGGGGSSSASSQSGSAIDGYLVGADVYLDKNKDGIAQDGEKVTKTGKDGSFSVSNPNKYDVLVKNGFNDTNGDGDQDKGEINNSVTLKATATTDGKFIVSPLTTLVHELLAQNPDMTPATAESTIKAALGIPGTVDLNTYDPLAAPDGDTTALAVYKAAVQIATAMTLVAGDLDPDAASAASAQFLTDLVEQLGTTVAPSPTDPNVPTSILLTTIMEVVGDSPVADKISDAVLLIDEATNVDDVSDSQASVVLAAPSVTLGSDTGNHSDKITSSGAYTVTAENGVKVEYSIDNGAHWSETKPSATEGVNSIQVRATDVAGNVSDVSTLAFTLDTSADKDTAASLVVANTLVNDTEKTAVSFTVAGLDADATGVVTFTDGTHTVTANVAVNGTATVDLSTLTDGNITSSLAITDTAGNTASATGNAIVLDTIKPTAPVIEVTEEIASGLSGQELLDGFRIDVNLSHTGAKAGDTLQLLIAGNVDYEIVLTADDIDAGVYHLDLQASEQDFIEGNVPEDGTYDFSARVVDQAGNIGADAPVQLTIDTTADVDSDLAVSVSNSLINDTEKTTVSFTVAGLDTDATGVVVFSDGENTVMADVAANGSGTVDLSSLKDGNISSSLVIIDTAGNIASATGNDIVLDATKPAAPIITAITDNTGSPTDRLTSDTTPTLTIQAEAGATIVLGSGGHPVDPNKYSVVETAPGIYTLTVLQPLAGDAGYGLKVIDAAGNHGDAAVSGSSATFRIDSVAPMAPTIDVTPDIASGLSRQELLDGFQIGVNLSGTGAKAGDTLQLLIAGDVDHAVVLTADDIDADVYYFELQATPEDFSNGNVPVDGTYGFSARVIDRAGNIGAEVTVPLIIDTIIATPTVALSTDSGTDGDKLSNDAALSISAKEADVTRVIMVDGQVVDSYNAASLEDGEHTVAVIDTDVAGNSKNASVTFTLDTTIAKPTVTLASDTGVNTSDHLTSNAALTVTGTENGAAVEYTLDGGINWLNQEAYEAAVANDGTYTVAAHQIDAAGNTSVASDALTFTLSKAAPTASIDSVQFFERMELGAVDADHVLVVHGTDMASLLAGDANTGDITGQLDFSKLTWSVDGTTPISLEHGIAKAEVVTNGDLWLHLTSAQYQALYETGALLDTANRVSDSLSIGAGFLVSASGVANTAHHTQNLTDSVYQQELVGTDPVPPIVYASQLELSGSGSFTADNVQAPLLDIGVSGNGALEVSVSAAQAPELVFEANQLANGSVILNLDALASGGDGGLISNIGAGGMTVILGNNVENITLQGSMTVVQLGEGGAIALGEGVQSVGVYDDKTADLNVTGFTSGEDRVLLDVDFLNALVVEGTFAPGMAADYGVFLNEGFLNYNQNTGVLSLDADFDFQTPDITLLQFQTGTVLQTSDVGIARIV